MSNMEESILKLIVGVAAATIAAIVAIFLYFLKKKDDEINLIKNKISDEKYKTYFDIVSMFFDILKKDKGLTNFSQEDLVKRYIDIKKNLLLLGSDDVIKKFTEFDKLLVNNDADALKKVSTWLELFIFIRKDSGNPKTKLSADDILKSIMDGEEYLSIKKLLGKR